MLQTFYNTHKLELILKRELRFQLLKSKKFESKMIAKSGL
jgi:hypothetical protein